METLQTYGVVSNRFSDTEYRDIEPVDDKFIGVSYYVAEDVDYAMSRDHDSKNSLSRDIDFYKEHLGKKQEVIDELHEILLYWKEQYFELKEQS